jgi:hypothetical protein
MHSVAIKLISKAPGPLQIPFDTNLGSNRFQEVVDRPGQGAHRPCRHHLMQIRISSESASDHGGGEYHFDIGRDAIGTEKLILVCGTETPRQLVHQP